MALGQDLGYKGEELTVFVSEQMNFERAERAAARELERETSF